MIISWWTCSHGPTGTTSDSGPRVTPSMNPAARRTTWNGNLQQPISAIEILGCHCLVAIWWRYEGSPMITVEKQLRSRAAEPSEAAMKTPVQPLQCLHSSGTVVGWGNQHCVSGGDPLVYSPFLQRLAGLNGSNVPLPCCPAGQEAEALFSSIFGWFQMGSTPCDLGDSDSTVSL